MTDQFTSLSPAALRDIIANIDRSLDIFARQGRLSPGELQVEKIMAALRARIVEQLENHSDASK